MSMQLTLTDQIGGVVSDELGVERDRIRPETDLQYDLGADSLDKLKLVMALEEAFHVGISSDALESLNTVEDIAKLVSESGRSESDVIH